MSIRATFAYTNSLQINEANFLLSRVVELFLQLILILISSILRDASQRRNYKPTFNVTPERRKQFKNVTAENLIAPEKLAVQYSRIESSLARMGGRTSRTINLNLFSVLCSRVENFT